MNNKTEQLKLLKFTTALNRLIIKEHENVFNFEKKLRESGELQSEVNSLARDNGIVMDDDEDWDKSDIREDEFYDFVFTLLDEYKKEFVEHKERLRKLENKITKDFKFEHIDLKDNYDYKGD